MTVTLVVIDAAHLLAAAGRCTGSGAARSASSFDLDKLLQGVLALLPAHAAPHVRWYDASNPGVATPAPRRRSGTDLEVVTTLLRGGRQRNIEALVLRDILSFLGLPSDESLRLYLVGDPRRHAVALESAADAGAEMVLVGVADGEPTPASRIWLRRPEVVGALRARRTGAQTRPPSTITGAYTAPDVRSTPVGVSVTRGSGARHPSAATRPLR